jgi:hypothetical protein
MKVKDIILNYLQEKDQWIFGGTIEREASSLHKPATISRELRRMSEENIILKRKERYNGILVVQYAYKGLEGNFEPNTGYASAYELATML